MEVIITKAQKNDIPQILEICASLNLSYWSRDDYESEVTLKDGIFLVAKEISNNKIIGFLVARLIMKDPNGSYFSEIYNIGVNRDFHRKQVGKKLILELLSECKKGNVKEIWLEVRSLNVVALEFYKGFGFTIQYTRKRFYADLFDDALVLCCKLIEM